MSNNVDRQINDIYDGFSGAYDDTYNNEICYLEDAEVCGRLDNIKCFGRVLDIGCGTGLFLELLNGQEPYDYGYEFYIDAYLGVDPSCGMLKEFRKKHNKNTLNLSFERYVNLDLGFAPDSLVSLYGSISYVKPEAVKEFFNDFKGNMFLMFYKKGYRPDYIPKDCKIYSAKDHGFEVSFEIADFEVVSL